MCRGVSHAPLGYIGREVDSESDLGAYGVRNYESSIARFLSTDPLWELYTIWKPYQYSLNNPVTLLDDGGKYVKGGSGMLTSAEKCILAKNPDVIQILLQNREVAESKSEELYDRSELHNGEGDAVRHAIFLALNAQRMGSDLAGDLGRAHETLDNPQEEVLVEKKMDLHNNAVGQQIGSTNKTAGVEEIVAKVLDAAKNGQLVVIQNAEIPNGAKLVPSGGKSGSLVLLDQPGKKWYTAPGSSSRNSDNTSVSSKKIIVEQESVKK